MKQRIRIGLCFIFCFWLFLTFNDFVKNELLQSGNNRYSLFYQTKEELAKNNKREGNFDFDSVESISLKNILKAKGEYKKLSVIGGIAVPSVAINLPIFKGLDNANLLTGAGTFSADQEMGKGNYALASHRTTNAQLLFTPLERVEMGDKIYLTDLNNVFIYHVISKQKVMPSDSEVLDVVEGRELVTLITCGDISGTTRLVVCGELECKMSLGKAPEKVKKAFSLPVKTYQ